MTKNTHDNTHALQCLEVWGGSSAADHAASVPGLDIAVHSHPVEGEAGGDLYLISSCSSGLIARTLIADVSGHGSSVSDLSQQLRRAMHKSINTPDQSRIAQALNRAFETIGDDGQFATALLMTYFAPGSLLVFVNAGHPPPLIKRDGTETWVPVRVEDETAITADSKGVRMGIRNLPLGVIRDTQYEQFAIRVSPGDRVVCYTDAFSEAKLDGSMLGVDGLAEILGGIDTETSHDLTERVLDEFEHRGIEFADDDHTIMSLRITGEGVKVSPLAFGRALLSSLGLGHKDTEPSAV